MNNLMKSIADSYSGYASYLWNEITHPSWHNYFYALILVSLFFFFLEVWIPWRKNQKVFRKDFWLDAFYMFFNFFIFSLIIYNAASDIVVNFFNVSVNDIFGVNLKEINPLYNSPLWLVLFLGFILRDFIQWWTHRLLHKFDFLWQFHKVHHSVEEMGFAAHLRYHWMETLVYRTIEYLPLALLLGIGIYDFFVIHIFTLAIGHYNHSNISINGKVTGGILGALIGIAIGFGLFDIRINVEPTALWTVTAIIICIAIGVYMIGPFMKKIFNSPEMHIWHHSEYLPETKRYGVNFGISLALWDYLFGTVYIPQNGRDIELGFKNVNQFPDTFIGQFFYGFKKEK